MGWFRRKASSPVTALKNASFLLGMGTGRGGLNSGSFDKLATEGYAQNAVVNACVNKIAASIASVDPTLYRRGKNGKLDKIAAHPLLDLLDNPNPTQSGKEFVRYLVSYYLTGGNAYVLANGLDPSVRNPKAPTELQLLNPGKVRIEPGKAMFPQFFEYKASASQTLAYPVDQVTGRSAVMQFKTFNPLNPWYGLPPMLAAAFGIDIHNGGNLWNKKLLDNDGRPSGALQVKGADGKPATLTDDQYQRIKEMVDDQYSGANNAGRPLLLEGGLEWQQMSVTPKDMDFLQAKYSAARDIGLVFGVPSQLLQIPGDSTFANYEQANLSYWTDTVIPLLCWFLEGFNRWLTPVFGDDLYLWYDEESIAALEPMRKLKADRINASTTMTIDEKRHAMGHDSLPNKLGEALVLDGRGILLGMDGSIVALGLNQSLDPASDPLAGGYQAPDPTDPQAAAKHKAWLVKIGYCTEERAERLAKLAYG